MYNFSEIVKQEGFPYVGFRPLFRLLASDGLILKSEKVVYEAVMDWLSFDILNRRHFMTDLISIVRLPMLPRDFFFTHVRNEPLFDYNVECLNLMDDTVRYLNAPDPSRVIIRPSQKVPRLTWQTNVLVVGGLFSIVNRYDLRDGQCHPGAAMPTVHCKYVYIYLNVHHYNYIQHIETNFLLWLFEFSVVDWHLWMTKCMWLADRPKLAQVIPEWIGMIHTLIDGLQ